MICSEDTVGHWQEGIRLTVTLVQVNEIRHYVWEGAHRALADTLALRAVWKHKPYKL